MSAEPCRRCLLYHEGPRISWTVGTGQLSGGYWCPAYGHGTPTYITLPYFGWYTCRYKRWGFPTKIKYHVGFLEGFLGASWGLPTNTWVTTPENWLMGHTLHLKDLFIICWRHIMPPGFYFGSPTYHTKGSFVSESTDALIKSSNIWSASLSLPLQAPELSNFFRLLNFYANFSNFCKLIWKFQVQENNLVHQFEDMTNASVLSEQKLPLVHIFVQFS